MNQAPLAYRLRPQSLTEFFGHQELIGPEKLLRKLIEEDQLQSLILWGPPGCGKTTMANIIAHETKSDFEEMSAVTSGKADVLKVIDRAAERKRLGERTILFIDEIHRFNRTQQDALLPHIENGTVIFIGATTENPSFELVSALLSRSQVFVMKALDETALLQILERALSKIPNPPEFEQEAKEALVEYSNGDARSLLNTLEIIISYQPTEKLNTENLKEILQRKNLRYDKNREEHYNIISALHKSMRDSDPDAAIYWTVRMLEGGEDPLYIARRMVRFASEDIGLADPGALNLAISVKEACDFLGMPECGVHLAQLAVYLSVAPKSNAIYTAYGEVMRDAQKFGNLEVPLHIRNAPTKLMKDIGYGKGYKYAHDYKGGVIQQEHLPSQLKNKTYYYPTDRGIEAKIKQRLADLKLNSNNSPYEK